MSLIISRVTRWLGVALVVAVGVLWWSNHNLRSRIDKLEDSVAGMQATAVSATVHERGTKRVLKQKEKSVEAVHKALEANPVWSDEPIPDDVSKLLQPPSSSSK